VGEKAHVQPGQLAVQLSVEAGLLGLLGQRFHVGGELADDVRDAQQVLLGLLEPTLGLALSRLVAGDAGGLLEQGAPVLGLGGENLVDAALPDDGVVLLAHAGVQEQVLHILQPAGYLVDEVLALAGPVHTAGDHDLREVEGQGAVAVIQHQRDLREAHGPLSVAASEDDVCHGTAPQRPGRLLAQHPADRIGHVGLAGTVRSDNSGDARGKLQLRLFREGLEAKDLQTLQVQYSLPPRSRRAPASRVSGASCDCSYSTGRQNSPLHETSRLLCRAGGWFICSFALLPWFDDESDCCALLAFDGNLGESRDGHEVNAVRRHVPPGDRNRLYRLVDRSRSNSLNLSAAFLPQDCSKSTCYRFRVRRC